MNKNDFYIAKQLNELMVYGYYYSESSGELVSSDRGFTTSRLSLTESKRIIAKMSFTSQDIDKISAVFWNGDEEFIGSQDNFIESSNGVFELKIQLEEAVYVGISIIKEGLQPPQMNKQIVLQMCIPIKPHYKQLNKEYKKESGQMFFRESLEGTIKLFGKDYNLVKNASVNENLFFYIYRKNGVFISASFNKSDCKFYDFKKSVELKLNYSDKYTKILDAYENTYDLIKLTPALTPITLTKRCVIQIYVQGENVLSNYAGGTYWETDVDEAVDSENKLTNKYYFSKGPKFVEVDLQGFNYDINAAYRGLSDNNIWNATSKREVGGIVSKMPCCIKFTKVASAGNIYTGKSASRVKLLSSGDGSGILTPAGGGVAVYMYDTYVIEIYTGRDGTGTKIYQSDYQYGKDTNFTLAVGEGLYPMSRIGQPVPQIDPTPNTFNLGEYVVEYQIWGRILCDAESIPDGQGGTISLYDLPYDDFATPRRNYKKCIGLSGFNSQNYVVSIMQTTDTSKSPTSYGIDDYGEYFMPPYSLAGQYFYPLSRSSWANSSLWVKLGFSGSVERFENFCKDYYKEYIVKDTYHICDVIQALLKKIDPTIKHEKTPEYSSFLYGHTGGTSAALGNCDIYITQKTNILKGEYDQAAQKAEIKFKQLMDMLRDCFRCYWFIDEQNRFRIEHVAYFINGMSYNSQTVQLDLTSKYDKFNKKSAIYCQSDFEYDKSELTSRYEFAWMDNSTKVMGGDLYIDVNNAYITKDKTDGISVGDFTSDIDYMLFLPDDFSNDGFALLMADSNKKIPIVNVKVKDEKQYDISIDTYAQNWFASFNNLVKHYTEDLSGNDISFNNIEDLQITGIKKCMKQSVEFPAEDDAISLYGLIKTNFGNGCIEKKSINIDTNSTEVELRFTPR